MTTLGWIILLGGSAGAAVFSYFTYFRREPVGRGRALLMALRTTILILIIILLIDPQLGARTRGSGRATRVVLDASLSMQPRAADSAIWREALRQARAGGSGPVIVAGEAPRTFAPDSLVHLLPTGHTSRVLPALQAAAEGGAERVLLVTDGAIEDAADVARWLPRLGIELDVRQIEVAATPNRAITEIHAPAWAEAGEPLTLRVSAAARGAAQSAAIVVRQGNEIVVRTELQFPSDGGLITTALSFNAAGPPQGGLVRFDVGFEQPDSIPDDDVRSAYVFIGEEPAGVAIVSFLPDWEPRFLHPVLEQALGVPVRTFLRVPNGSYFRAGASLQAGTRVEETAVLAAVAQADLLVLHGLTENAPAWWRGAAANARRIMIFPAEALGDPYEVSAPVQGDWYVSGEIPASPIAGFLENVDVSEVPPLQNLFTTRGVDDGWSALNVGRTRRGGVTPVLSVRQAGNRRIVIALGSGYWRWSFRGGAGRDLYTRMWGALAGWMAQDQPQVAGAAIRPVSRTVPRGTPLRWLAPGLTPDSLAVRITAGDRVVHESVSRSQQGDTALTAPLPPGHYRYMARAFVQNQAVAEADGSVTVESYSPEFMRAPADLAALRAGPGRLAEQQRPGGGRPLHASGWPWVLLVLLLCAEWIFRRRWGLR